MPELLTNFFLTKQFIPHGHCYLWKPELVGLHILADTLIALAYYSIPVMLVYLLYKRRDVPFPGIFLLFGAFIVACGTTHVMEIWTLWHPSYWLSGLIKAITAIISLYTAGELMPLLPKVLALPSPAQLQAANLALETEITERRRVEQALQTEQEFLKVLLNNVEAGIVACDAAGVLTVFNQVARKFHGLAEQPLPADQWARHYSLYLPDGKTEMKTEDVPLFRALQGECISNIEMKIVPQQGTARTLLASGQALYDVQGKKLGAVAVMHDITERQRAEAALRQSEAKNRALLNAIPDLILCLSKDGTYLDYKPPKTFEMLASGSDLVGKSECEVLPPAVAQQRLHYVEQALATGEPQVFEYQLQLNGNDRDEEARIVAYGEAEVLVIVRDITERKQVEEQTRNLNAELEQRVAQRTMELRAANQKLTNEIAERQRAAAALRQSEQQLRLITDALPVLISYVDTKQCYRFNNRAYEQWFGHSRTQITGQHLSQVLGESAYQAVERYVEAALSGQEVTYESIVPYKDGGTRYIHATCLPDFGEQGEVKGYIALISDITDRKQAEVEICRLNAELEQRVVERTAQLAAANRELEAFSYSVSHDLRAPLRSIDGFSQALLEDYSNQLDALGQDYLQRVRRATQRMGQLIDDLLNLSQVTRRELQRESVALSELAQVIATELQQTQPERQVEFAIAPGLIATGDAQLLRIVLENLLGNAWKFTGKQIRARIEFGCCQPEGKPAFFVRDDGTGFDMAYAAKLFGAFQRLHSLAEFEGTGIGLATVQRIIHRHGGCVWAEGALAQGATFYFTL